MAAGNRSLSILIGFIELFSGPTKENIKKICTEGDPEDNNFSSFSIDVIRFPVVVSNTCEEEMS